MKEIFKQHIISLYKDVPVSMYVVLFILLIIGGIIIFSLDGIRNKSNKFTGFLLIVYVSLILCSTVLFRTYTEHLAHDFRPFWSYMAIQEGYQDVLIAENFMNVMAFVPVGILLVCTFSGMKWWQVLLIGVFLSISIETLQFFLKRGFAETDDVMHNTLGCLIGYGLCQLIVKINKFVEKISAIK